jgi:hypothetical protein
MDALDLSMDENPSVIAFAILSNYIPPPVFRFRWEGIAQMRLPYRLFVQDLR